MAIIKAMLGQKVIDGFKGVIDFYFYKGIPCARAWPKSPGRLRSPGVMSTWEAFAYSSRMWGSLSPVVRRSYEELATGTGLSARDMFTRSYLKGLYAYPTGASP